MIYVLDVNKQMYLTPSSFTGVNNRVTKIRKLVT